MRYDPPFRHTTGFLPALAVLALLIVFPLVFTESHARHLLILVFVYAIVAASWDLSLGYGGLVNFSHVALFAVGIYAYGILAKTLGVSPWLAIPAGGAIAVVIASAIALPILRLDGIYVILVTLAFSQLLYQIVISQSGVTGGAGGMVTLPGLAIGDYRFIRDNRIGYYYVALALLCASLACLYGIVKSGLGRAIVALRDNKYYAMARGVSEARTRLMTLAASAFFAGLAGAFYGSYVRVASPDAFGLGMLTLMLSMLLAGGIGTLWGAVAGAFAITLLSEAIADYGSWRTIVIAVIIIAVLIFYPGGFWAAIQELRDFVDQARTTSLARWRRISGRAARERMLGAKETMIATRYGRIAVADTGGAGAPILFIHGNSACKEAFVRQFKALAGEYRVIAFDLPGHGVSDNMDPEAAYNVPAYAEIAEAVLQKLGVASPAVFGWSLGGYVALELAARGHVAVRALAIAGTPPLNVVPDDFAAGYDPDSHLVLAGKRYFSPREARNFAGAATAPLSRDSAFMHKTFARTDGRARFFMISQVGVTDWPRQMRMLREGKIPFAILNGSDDPFLNHAYFRGLAYGAIWTGEPHDIPGGKHAPFFNKPELFNEALRAFLRETAAGEPLPPSRGKERPYPRSA
jgi:ABC-type branched-subunit amino acid transport system permease subunit/pimeloyl-ACP methyl ester carboxylesterase